MRIWDLDPGFLNDRSLLGEHRELHGLFSIHINGKKGYARHPETLRWKNALSGLRLRHDLLVCEMRLRGFNHKSPLEDDRKEAGDQVIRELETGILNADTCRRSVRWPEIFIDPPEAQFLLLKEKYRDRPQGRIPLPRNEYDLWASHKYSVMARDPALYRTLGPEIANKTIPFSALSLTLVTALREPPGRSRLINALDHMWGYVSSSSPARREDLEPAALLEEIRRLTRMEKITYLLHSTALGELGAWVAPKNNFSASVQRDGD